MSTRKPAGTDLCRIYDEGKTAMLKSDFKRARKLFSRALKAYQQEADSIEDLSVVYVARSAAHYHLEHYSDSMHDAKKAIEIRPNWSKGHFRQAEALLAMHDVGGALEAYQKARSLESDERSLDLVDLRILLLEQQRQARESEIYFEQLRPGHEICLRTYNPIKRLIYEFARGMQNIVYAIGDVRSKECVIVDACWDADGIMKRISTDGMVPVACIVTHNHFDHVGGKPPPPFKAHGITVQGIKTILAKHPAIKVYVHRDDVDAFQNDSRIEPDRIIPSEDGTELTIGTRLKIRFIHTPGHTPGAQCLLVNETRLITGDTLFAGSCGRMDLPGGSPIQMYHTLQSILATMPPETAIYPGHSYGNSRVSTIGREIKYGVLRPISLEGWLQRLQPS